MRSLFALTNSADGWLDKVVLASAAICALHCLLTPLVVGLFPLLGLACLADERTEWTFLDISLLLGVSSLTAGYCRHHRRPAPFFLFVVGALLILSVRFFVEARQRIEISMVVIGAVFIAFGHGQSPALPDVYTLSARERL